MLGIVVADLLKELRYLSPMFCGCCLMQKGGQRKRILGMAKQVINKGLHIDPIGNAPPMNQPYLLEVMKQMDYADDPTNVLLSNDWLRVPTDSNIRAQRDRARVRLSRNLAHSEIDHYGRIRKYVHGCPLGCHASREEAVQEICDDLDLIQMGRKVPVPAINRWLGLFAPTAYWKNAHLLGYLGDAIEILNMAGDELAPLLDSDIFGMASEDTYKKKGLRRFKCLAGWVNEEGTGRRLAIASVIISVLVQFMGYFFTDSSYGEGQGSGNGKGFFFIYMRGDKSKHEGS
jgi:hypothetical protein